MLTKRQLAEVKSRIGGSTPSIPLALQALGDPGRFNIFRVLIEHHDICVTDIANVFAITVSAASQQLRVLERLGLVIRVRMGQMVCYEINQGNAIAKQLVKLIKESSS